MYYICNMNKSIFSFAYLIDDKVQSHSANDKAIEAEIVFIPQGQGIYKCTPYFI